jgi:hypothetical protein
MVAIPLSRLSKATVIGDLNALANYPFVFVGVDSRLGLIRWTILVCGGVIVVAFLAVRLARPRLLPALDPETTPRESEQAEYPSGARLAALTAGLIGALLVAAVIVVNRMASTSEGYIPILGDDQMISMRYAYNFVHGAGLTWNPDELVEGYTNLGWTLVMVLAHLAVPGIIWPALFVQLAVIALIGITAWACARICIDEYRLRPAAGAVGGVLSASLPPVLCWASEGYEVAPLCANLAIALLLALRDIRARNLRTLTICAFAILSVWRADAAISAILFGVTAAVLAASNRSGVIRNVIRVGLIVGAAAALQIGWRLAYYGQLFPNTAVLKTENFPNRFEVGIAYVATNGVAYLPILIAAFLLLRRPLRHAELLVIVPSLLLIVIVAYEGGDVVPYGRVFAFVIPVVVTVIWGRFAEVIKPAGRRWPIAVAAAVATTFLCADTLTFVRQYDGDREMYADVVEVSLRLGSTVPAGSKIALFWAGAPAYYSQLPAIDLLGKMDPEIARSTARGVTPGHNKYDFDFSISHHRPDYVLDVPRSRPTPEEIAIGQRSGYPFSGDLWTSEMFLQHCAENEVAGLLGVYACRYV